MLYTNTKLFGTTRFIGINDKGEPELRYGFPVGVRGKDEYEIFILSTKELMDKLMTIKSHTVYPNINIVKTPNGNLKLTDQGDVGEVYLVITSEYLNPEGGCGKVTVISMNGQPTADFMGKGVMAVRDENGNIKGTADTLILKAKPGSLIKVRWSGYEKHRINDVFYYISPMGNVNEFSALEMKESFEKKGHVPSWISNGIR